MTQNNCMLMCRIFVFVLSNTADPAALGFIISPWSLLLLPSGSVSFTDDNVSHQDLRAFTAPEVLQNQSLSSLSDVEKVLCLLYCRVLSLNGPFCLQNSLFVCFIDFFWERGGTLLLFNLYM